MFTHKEDSMHNLRHSWGCTVVLTLLLFSTPPSPESSSFEKRAPFMFHCYEKPGNHPWKLPWSKKVSLQDRLFRCSWRILTVNNIDIRVQYCYVRSVILLLHSDKINLIRFFSCFFCNLFFVLCYTFFLLDVLFAI